MDSHRVSFYLFAKDCRDEYCGDGITQPDNGEEPAEVCEPITTSTGATAYCDDNCQPHSCGDGTTDPELGEECDDGNNDNDDDCNSGMCAVCCVPRSALACSELIDTSLFVA